MRSPYEGLASSCFWKSGVAAQSPDTIADLYRKRFPIERTTRVATAGSCFAQHISRFLRARGFNVIDAEPPPDRLDPEIAQRYGYGLYSARYGNIYLVRQLLQLAQEVFGEFEPSNAIWEKDGRYFDALRPGVEPTGLDSAENVRAHRLDHLKRVREVLCSADVFVFTLGLTEGWIDRASGTTYPTAPGTIAGQFDDTVAFKNFRHSEIIDDFVKFRELVKQHNPGIRFLLTVSPVPLTATASGQHVLAATTYSKSVLRAVAGELYERFEDVDYFPSYEMVATPFSHADFYEPNLRSVTELGVQTVMRVFFLEHDRDNVTAVEAAPRRPVMAARQARAAQPDTAREERRQRRQMERKRQRRAERKSASDPVCEEVLLNAFAK